MNESMEHRSDVQPGREVYVLRDSAATVAALARRTAQGNAAFFLPQLRPGMRLLDCGCGPGSIALGLAEAVAPGEVVGIDLQPGQVELARSRAAERGVTNVRFEVGSVYDLPFPDGSFDATFAHQVLMYLREPVRALREMRRVLRPGGVAGIRDQDEGGTLLSPALPLVEEMERLRLRAQEFHGGSPFYARHQRRMLLEAGFARAEARAETSSAGSPDGTRAMVAQLRTRFFAPLIVETVLAQGWADEARLEAMRAELEAWGERPDAFRAWTNCAAVGWAGD